MGCWPTLGQLTVRGVRFKAVCRLWWDIFEQKVYIAFDHGDYEHGGASRFDWDVDMSLAGCGVPLPAAVEDELASHLITMVMQSNNRLNPMVVDLGTENMDNSYLESMAATVLQAAQRRKSAVSKKAKRKSDSAAAHADAEVDALRTTVASMEREVTELKRDLVNTTKALSQLSKENDVVKAAFKELTDANALEAAIKELHDLKEETAAIKAVVQQNSEAKATNDAMKAELRDLKEDNAAVKAAVSALSASAPSEGSAAPLSATPSAAARVRRHVSPLDAS